MYHLYEPRDDDEAAELAEVHQVHNALARLREPRQRATAAALAAKRAELAFVEAQTHRPQHPDVWDSYHARALRLRREIAALEAGESK